MDISLNPPDVDQPADDEQPPRENNGLDENESEWEYEYNENETEDFYITLDLSSYAPMLPRKRKRESELPLPPPSSRTPEVSQASPDPESTPIQARNAAGSEAPSRGGAEEAVDPNLSAIEHQSPPAESKPGQGEIKIFSLSSNNPVVQFEGNIYSCSWGTSLGTDLLFSIHSDTQSATPTTVPFSAQTPPTLDGTQRISHSPTANANLYSHPPKRSNPLLKTRHYTLQAATSLRLTAKPAEITPRAPPAAPTLKSRQEQPSTLEVAPSTATTIAPPISPAPSASTPSAVTLPPAAEISQKPYSQAQRRRQGQVYFLSRLAAVKRAKGEVDRVPLWINEPNHQPASGVATIGGAGAAAAAGGLGLNVGGGVGVGLGSGSGANGSMDSAADWDDPEERKNKLRRERRWRERFRVVDAALGVSSSGAVGRVEGGGDRGDGEGEDEEEREGEGGEDGGAEEEIEEEDDDDDDDDEEGEEDGQAEAQGEEAEAQGETTEQSLNDTNEPTHTPTQDPIAFATDADANADANAGSKSMPPAPER